MVRNYAKAQAELKDKYPSGVYYHNYLFPHNDKRTYRNQLTMIGDGVVYLGVILQDKTNRHWIPKVVDTKVKRLGKPVLSKKEKREFIDSGIKVIQTPDTMPLVGNNAPVGFKHYYEHNGLVLSFKRPKLRSYFSNILNCDGEVKYLGLRVIEVTPPAPKKRVSKFEIYRQQFDRLPKGYKFCCYCETELDRYTTTRDHIIPVSRGGKGSDYGHENIKPCCATCNSEKGNLMLHSYIQLLNYKMADVAPGSQEYRKLQTKINNANNIAKSINLI